MDLHKKYMEFSTNDISILEIIDASFKDDPFLYLHRLVQFYNNEIIKNTLDIKKLQTFHTILCYEYQFRFHSNNICAYKNLEDFSFQNIENVLFPQNQWRNMSEILFIYDILLLQMVLYCDMQSIKIKLENLRKFRNSNLNNSNDTRELYMKVLECFLDTLHLQCYLFKNGKQEEYEEFIPLYIEDIKCLITTKDDIQWRSLASIIPKINRTFEKRKVVFPIWNLFLNELKDLEDLLATINILAEHYFSLEKDSLCDLYYDLYCKDRFWSIISKGLESSVQQYRKWALFLMKKTIDFMSEIKFENSHLKKNTLTPFICNTCPKNVKSNKEKFFLVLEALEEKQKHLILPALTHLPGLIKSNEVCGNCFNIIWLGCIFKRILQHENNNIVKLGLLNICNMDVIMCDEQFLGFFVNMLNNTFLYEIESDNNESEIIKELTGLLSRITRHKNKFILKKFLYHISQIKWGPVAMFYVTHILYTVFEENQHYIELEDNDLNAIQRLISLNLNMHSPILRIASHINIIKMISYSSIAVNDLELLANVLSTFPSEEVLRRGSNTWEIIIKWLPKVITKCNAANFISHISEKYLLKNQFEINIDTFALMIFLLYDAKLIFYSKSCPAIQAIKTCLDSLIGSDMRPYSNLYSNIKILELMSYLLKVNIMGNCNNITQMLFSYGDTAMRVIIKNLRKATMTLCYEDLDKFLNIITTFFNNRDLLFSKEAMCMYAENLQKPLLVNINSVQGTEYLSILHVLLLCQSTNLALCSKETYEFCIANMHKFQVLNNECCYTENEKGKIMSHYYFLMTKLIYNYLQQFSMELWKIEWYDIISNLLQLEGIKIIPTVAIILKTIIEKNGLQSSEDIENFTSTVQLCWRITFLNKKDAIFSVAVKNLVAIIVNSKFLNLPNIVIIINPFLTQLIQESDNIPNLKRILLIHMETLDINNILYNKINFDKLLLACLLHGYAIRRDKKIENQICLYIEKNLQDFYKLHLSITDYNNDAIVRAQATILLHKIITKKPEYASIFLHSVLAELEKNKNKRYFKDSHLHRVKHRLIQILLVLEPLLNMESISSLQEILCNLILLESNQHSIRLMQEWLLIRIFVKYPNLHNKLWNFFEESLLKRPGCTSSIASVIYHVALLLSGQTQCDFLRQAMPYIACCCLGQNYNMRLYNQVILVKLYELLKCSNFDDIILEYAGLYNAALKSLQQGNLMKNSLKVQDDFYFSVFHPIEDYSLQTIYFEIPRLSAMDADEWITSHLFHDLNFTETINHPLCLQNLNKKLAESKICMHLIKSGPCNKETSHFNEMDDDGLCNIQKKITPVKSVNSIENSIGIMSLQNTVSNIIDESIIIVASLIDRPANLGGLARTCEIFGANELIIGNLQYTKEKEFQNLSVSSDKWINITEVKPYQLCEYLLEKKDMGWDLVGVEQTANSINLLNMKFKKKTILVLGNEKSGIPANLIPLFDVCVEVPQVGIIRSLNVHVTGAICIWQYAKQHIFV
ncbi:probable methyltransferase TARBP1 isoform X1 [Vespa crabro]|uniref:probable methyltransferase TARBP1 isoform X1 n=1 Tax=Vespa crabro TaxID=7445 RepID=UPI001F006892|nr:probable methyltransferase TARBP1 isoform X1 [Vespa crabro]